MVMLILNYYTSRNNNITVNDNGILILNYTNQNNGIIIKLTILTKQ
jgi:hypothetical protein